jgi:hypothetical protein
MDFKGRMDAQSDTFFRIKVTRIFTTLSQHEKSDNFRVTVSLARKYILQQPQLMFEKLCKEETVKIWLEKDSRGA